MSSKNRYLKPFLIKHGALLEITNQGAGKYPGPGDGKSAPNSNTCPYGQYKKGNCVNDAFS